MQQKSAEALKKIYNLLEDVDSEGKSHLVTNLYHSAEILSDDHEEWERIDKDFRELLNQS